MNNSENKIKEIIPNDFIDITSDRCPMTFVKTKLKIEKMKSGQILEVLLNEGEPLKNVPLSAQELGHQILEISAQNDNQTYKILIQKK